MQLQKSQINKHSSLKARALNKQKLSVCLFSKVIQQRPKGQRRFRGRKPLISQPCRENIDLISWKKVALPGSLVNRTEAESTLVNSAKSTFSYLVQARAFVEEARRPVDVGHGRDTDTIFAPPKFSTQGGLTYYFTLVVRRLLRGIWST